MNEQAMMLNKKQQQPLMNMNQGFMSMNQMNQHQQQQPKPQMVQMNHGYRTWPPQQQFRNPNSYPGDMNPPSSAFNKSLAPRNNWKGKKVNKKPHDKRRMEQKKSLILGVDVISGGGLNLNFNSFNPPTVNESQHQNRIKTRNFFPKRKFDKNNSMNMNTSGDHSRSAPFAPRNTTSFIIRSKKSGGIAPSISPCPVTPSVLPTPILSPSRELLVDMAKEEWGVDGYGSMKGLIRLRSPEHEMYGHDDEEEGSSESDVEEHVEVERRLDHDLSRFEMIYNPNSVLENRVDDQDSHIAQLEDENLILKERLFFMERELGDLRRMMMCLERVGNGGEVINHESENGSESNSLEVENKEGLNVGGKNNNNTIDVGCKEESNENSDESN